MTEIYLGLMSGTSMDGIDAALVDFSGDIPKLIDFNTFKYPPHLLEQLNSLCRENDNEIVHMGQADRVVGRVFAQAVNKLLEQNNFQASQIKAIGSHGQTVRHHPAGAQGFSLQIGDPNTIAVLTGIDVIADFRRKDVALGGQGAPLAPAFHHAVFADYRQSRAVLNIGGIANITYLPSGKNKPVLGFDTGPGNTLLDAWCKKHTGKNYDEKGAWAAQGKVDPMLLQGLLSHPYFAEPAPKSTGRETFNLNWLEQQLAVQPHDIDEHSVQATLVMLTCHSIAQQVNLLKDVQQLYVCGGGAQNDFLMECLENELFDCELFATDELGIHPDAVEAMAFAWFAYAHQNKLPGNIPSVTGARRQAILGAYFPAA